MTTTWTVERDCCLSGNCERCYHLRYGQKVRVVHAHGVTKEQADKYLAGWKDYHPVATEHGVACRYCAAGDVPFRDPLYPERWVHDVTWPGDREPGYEVLAPCTNPPPEGA